MAQDTYVSLVGRPVALEGTTGPFRACPYCVSHRGIVAPGAGPHIAAINCAQCERHLSWLGRDHLDAMAAQKWDQGAA